jgi:hypothetical protein
VARLNEDGSESFHSRYDTEEEAKQMAGMIRLHRTRTAEKIDLSPRVD